MWYNIDCPERVTMVTIKGDIEEIERAEGKPITAQYVSHLTLYSQSQPSILVTWPQITANNKLVQSLLLSR